MARRVLFIQHTGSLGGSAMSLLFTVKALDPARFTAVVALIRPTDPVRALYRGQGIHTVDAPGIQTFEHTTANWASMVRPLTLLPLAKTILGWRASQVAVRKLLERTNPDLVHLNSAVLLPAAFALRRGAVPFVWHIRECPPPTGGLRTWLLRCALRRYPSGVVFLSHAERRAWVGDETGSVIYNSVDVNTFRNVGRAEARAQLGIPADAKVVLYLGSVNKIKGICPLLRAIQTLRSHFEQLVVLMPGSIHVPSSRFTSRVARRLLSLVGSRTLTQDVDETIRREGLATICRRSPYAADIRTHIAASDLVVFPATREHFARPILEAGAAARPVVASRFPVTEELVVEGKTGLLVPPGDSVALASAMAELLTDDARAAAMGQEALARARTRFDVRANTDALMGVFECACIRRV